MDSYQVNADELFSDDSDDDAPSAIPTVSVKRPRVTPYASINSSISASTLPSSSNSAPAPRLNAFPSFKPSSAVRQPAGSHNTFRSLNPRPQIHPRRDSIHPPRIFQSTASGMGTGHRDGFSSLAPRGRGRGATLPSHLTGEANLGVHKVKEDAVSRVESAASILPEHMRAAFIEEEKRKAEIPKKRVANERKRPTRKRKIEGSEDARNKAKKLTNIYSNTSKPQFGLQNLLKVAQPKSLIKLNSGGSSGGGGGVRKVKRDVTSFYKAASMTKEALEREERLKRKEKMKMEEERMLIAEHWKVEREKERAKLHMMAGEWRRQKSVSSSMRDNLSMRWVENFLFGKPEDKDKLNLEYLGLQIKPVKEEKQVTNLLTVEVLQI